MSRPVLLFDTAPLISWTLSHILPVILLVIGIQIILKSRRGELRETTHTLAGVLIGVFVILGAGAFIAFADKLTNLVTK